MADNQYKYFAFLSCSPQDNGASLSDSPAASRRCWGNWLDDALRNFSIPPEFVGQINGRGEIIPERIAPVFRDESERPEAVGLSAEIRQALDHSICLIVICSPRSAQNRQMNEVASYFKQLGRGQQILPVVIAGAPNASTKNQPGVSPADECYVPALRHPVKPDGSLDTTRRAGKHIFVDARHGAEKREILAHDHRPAEATLEMAKIQLIAWVIGVGFNGLWWREQQRHFLDFAEAQRQAQEALNQVEEVRRQLQEAQHQTREAQQQSLELQNLPREVQTQIQEAQSQALTAQDQARAAQQQLQEFQNKVRETQAQLEEALSRARAAESKVLEAQQATREIQSQLEATRIQARDAQNQRQAGQTQESQNQVLNAQRAAQIAQSQIQEFQIQAQVAQSQLAEARQHVCAAQNRIQELQNQSRAGQDLLKATQDQVQKIQDQDRNARRLTQVFAVLAALALLAAGIIASNAWRQRQLDHQALAKAAAEASGTFDLAFNQGEPIRQMLQKIGGAEQKENRRRSLDQLAAAISPEEIPAALKAALIIVDDQQRSHFQKELLVRLGRVNPLSAMTNASAIEEKIVNDAGASDSSLYFQLAVLANWMQTDWAGAFHWVCQLPDADSRQRALDEIIRFAQSQPDAKAKNLALVNCIGELAKTDVPAALALAESLPATAGRDTLIASLWIMMAEPFVVSEWINCFVLPPEINSPRQTSWPWTTSFTHAHFCRPALLPVAAETLGTATNRPIQIQPQK